MRTFIYGTIFGIIIATVGFTGIARMLDKAVVKTKETATELSK
jgi:hypothetical protein